MSFYLYILRHAKSDWSTGHADFDRPLNKRGRKNAQRMGQWLVENKHVPELVICSPAERARQTLELVSRSFKKFSEESIVYDRDLYLADVDVMLNKILLFKHGVNSLMLVAHNPGMDYLVSRLSRNGLKADAQGKLMTTAALAVFEYRDEAFDPDSDKPISMQLIRPKELD